MGINKEFFESAGSCSRAWAGWEPSPEQPLGALVRRWGGGFFPGAPSRETCLPAPQKSSHPRSKEGLLHSSCLKFLLNKSSGYRGIFQLGSCSQLSSPAGSRMCAGRKAAVPARRFLPTFPRVHCPGLCLPPCSHCSLCLAGCKFTARLSNLLCKLTPPRQAEPSPRRRGLCVAVGVQTQALGAELPALVLGTARAMGTHLLLYRCSGATTLPQPCQAEATTVPCAFLSSCPRGRRGSVVPAAAPEREGTPCPPHQDGSCLACSKAALHGKGKEAGILSEPSISQH